MITKDKGTKYFCTSDVFHKDLMSRQKKHVLARYNWRKRSIPTHSEWLYPLTFDAGKGLKEA